MQQAHVLLFNAYYDAYLKLRKSALYNFLINCLQFLIWNGASFNSNAIPPSLLWELLDIVQHSRQITFIDLNRGALIRFQIHAKSSSNIDRGSPNLGFSSRSSHQEMSESV